LVRTISNVLVMEIGWTDVGSGGYILVSSAHSNTSFTQISDRILNKNMAWMHLSLFEWVLKSDIYEEENWWFSTLLKIIWKRVFIFVISLKDNLEIHFSVIFFNEGCWEPVLLFFIYYTHLPWTYQWKLNTEYYIISSVCIRENMFFVIKIIIVYQFLYSNLLPFEIFDDNFRNWW
jgi:hypothetical protein